MNTVEPIVISELKHKHNSPIVTRLDIDGTLYELHDANLDAEIENIEQALLNTQEAVNSVAEDLGHINSYLGTLETAISNKVDKISYTTADISNHSIIKNITVDLTGNEPITLTTQELNAKNVLASNLTEYSRDNEYALNEKDISYLATYGTENEAFTDKTYLTHDILVYLLKKVNTMSGIDPALLASLEKIVAELEGDESSEAANMWITLVDKLKGLGDETVKEYVDRITSNLWARFPNLSYTSVNNYEFAYNEENTTLTFNKNVVNVYTYSSEIPESQVYYKS